MKVTGVLRRLALILMVGVLATALGSAQGAARKDFQIALDIYNAVMNYDRYSIFDDVTANVKDGVATLTGKVTRQDIKTEIEKRVKKIKGVVAVKNEIGVHRAVGHHVPARI